MENNTEIVYILTFGFALASLFGYLAQRLNLPAVLGYLLAGFFIGPYSPGFVADIKVSEQLAEIGIILMLFGVGLHFKITDLLKVKSIALPGAIGQVMVSSLFGMWLVYSAGWTLQAGAIIGLALGVASTVVLVRVLTDNHLLHTERGHIAVGWLIVEDILTVFILLIIPMLPTIEGSEGFVTIISALGLIIFKFFLLIAVMFTIGQKVVSYFLNKVVRLRSHELFTLSVIALIFLIAAASSIFFSTSIALGAFIAGMVIGQTDVKHQASANASPVKDMFSIIFFLSVGMLFNPYAVGDHILLFLGMLAIILLIKPLAAFLIVRLLNYSSSIALTIAVALAQIGEFSFILGEQAMHFNLIPEAAYDLIVTCAIISISLNPLLFNLTHLLDHPEKEEDKEKLEKHSVLSKRKEPYDPSKVVIIGYDSIGQECAAKVRDMGFNPVIIENNIDTVVQKKEDEKIIFGDASSEAILSAVNLSHAKALIITISDINASMNIIKLALHLNPHIKILARINYLSEKSLMEALGILFACSEEELSKSFKGQLDRLLT